MRHGLLLCGALVLAIVAVGLAGCGGGEEEAAPATPPAAELPARDGEAVTTELTGDATAGRAVYDQAGCGGCHTLADADSSGAIGPNLDDLAPDFERVEEQVKTGGGGMPAFEGALTEQQIADVAAYVSSAAGT